MRRLAILGAGGHGRVVADTALQAGWDNITFFDDVLKRTSEKENYTVIGDTTSLLEQLGRFDGVLVAIGDNRARLSKVQQFLNRGVNLPSLCHPFSYVANDVELGEGAVIFAGAVVQPGCVLGRASIINTGATVDHDCSLAAGSHVCPGVHLAGEVSVGECAWIGVGATVNQRIAVGADVIIGAGAAVVSDVPNNLTLVGVPALPICKD